MGVNLKGIITPVRISIQQLRGRVLAIDAYNALYQFLAIIRGKYGEPLTDEEGRVTSHLSGLFYRNINLLELGIKPIYILDGKPPSLKFIEIERRKIKKKKAIESYKRALELGNIAAAKKYAQGTSYVKDYMIEDSKLILDLLGIPWIEAPSEGEATAAYLTRIGLATDAVSQDFDALLFGAERFLRNVTISGKRRTPRRGGYVDIEPEEIELNKLLQDLEITREQLIDIGILTGTDFNPNGFKGIGPITALKLIKKFGAIEKIENIKKDINYINYKEIRNIFLNPIVTKPKKNLIWKQPDESKIISFLHEERSFSQVRILKSLEKLRKKNERYESLEKWF